MPNGSKYLYSTYTSPKSKDIGSTSRPRYIYHIATWTFDRSGVCGLGGAVLRSSGCRRFEVLQDLIILQDSKHTNNAYFLGSYSIEIGTALGFGLFGASGVGLMVLDLRVWPML